MDKGIRLVVEVDGFQHEKYLQHIRDSKKDSILRQAGIPLLRIKTSEAHCKEKIIDALGL